MIDGDPRRLAGVFVVVVTIVAATVLALATSGASGAESAPPMSHSERDARRSAYLDGLWSEVAEEYPEAIRPVVAFNRVTNDRGRREAAAACLAAAGISTEVIGNQLVYSSGNGQTALEVAVTFYSCTARFPTIHTMTDGLSSTQLDALFRYYSGSLRPCLALSGHPTWIPPSRADFVADGGHHTWNPYLPLRGSYPSLARLDSLDRQCPAVPAWLDFATP